jgi:hypothetical protein
MVILVASSCRERLPDTPALAKAIAHQTSTHNTGKLTHQGPPKNIESALTGGKLVFADNFERSFLGDDWKAKATGWRLVDGTVVNHHADNAGFWLLKPLPKGDVRIEFDARSDSFTQKIKGQTQETFPGDLKCEAFGIKPEHQTGYIFIFGGWSNQVNRIARLEEHGDGEGARVEDGATHPVQPGKTYRLKVVKKGSTVAWYANEQYLVHMTDDSFIPGRYFGFNNWRSHVTFDNVAIYDLN